VSGVAEIPAALVKELRDVTGAGMMECKRALVEANGDLDEAVRILRERGLAAAGKRAGQETTEGKVLARVAEPGGGEGVGAIVAVGCETEPVASNEEFLAFAQHVLDVVAVEGPEAVENLEAERAQLVARIRENIVVLGATRLEAENGEVLSSYIHPPAERIGVLVRAKASPELARMVAMHISFANPSYLRREDVPEAEVAAERSIYEKLPEVTAKPEHIRPQIVDGMLAKRFFAELVLLDQAWIHDPDRTVGQALDEHDAEVREFVRLSVAG
jgi:elongation factor Ts